MIAVLGDAERSRSHGGRWRSLLSFALAFVLGAFIAPVILLHRAEIVFSLLLGRTVGWGAQQRAHSVGLAEAARHEAPVTLLGLALQPLLLLVAPGLFWWLAPISIPWALSIPLVWLLSSPTVGAWTRRFGWFLVPSESGRDELLDRAAALRALTAADDSARFRDLVLDPVLLAAHLSRLAQPAPGAREWLHKLRERALRVGPAALSSFERSTLTGDAASMRWLHREGWRHWPVESWQLARERPLVPADSQPYASKQPEPQPQVG
jgi:membrane glycosyltransferase